MDFKYIIVASLTPQMRRRMILLLKVKLFISLLYRRYLVESEVDYQSQQPV